jgi:hypothetical protein
MDDVGKQALLWMACVLAVLLLCWGALNWWVW